MNIEGYGLHSPFRKVALEAVDKFNIKESCVSDFKELLELIPRDKFDLKPFTTLMTISEKEVKPILPALLFCVADMNWPIASEMVKVLIRFPESVVLIIKGVLQSTEKDESWKWFIITSLIPELPEKYQELLLEDINRIVHHPTSSELDEEVEEVAKNYLKTWWGCNE